MVNNVTVILVVRDSCQINSVFARIERGQGADLGKGHFCARPIILRALLCAAYHFEGTFTRDFTF